jgi:predicted metallo-beta-lactamase superfamily hydrolase
VLSLKVIGGVDALICMLKHVKIVPLAAESFGVRSMCTYVETPDVRVLLDAGISLCPYRFGLPPHPKEFKAIESCRRKIAETAEKAEIVTVSHYHFDHHTPSFEDWICNWTEMIDTAKQIYEDKTVLTKNPKEKINYSQRRRGWVFQLTGGKFARKLEVADGESFHFGSTTLRFSEPVFHGPENSELGWVLMVTVEFQDEKFLFAPDVQGPMSTKTLELILNEKPEVLMIGGPPFYLAEFKVAPREIQISLKNLAKIIEEIPCVVLEHHALRDENWRKFMKEIFDRASQKGHRILTAAEFSNCANVFLEARRKLLFLEDPPSMEFEKWMKKGVEVQKRLKPPI